MIKCNIQMSHDINQVEVSGNPAAIYAEIGEIIKEALATMNHEEQDAFQAKLMAEVKTF